MIGFGVGIADLMRVHGSRGWRPGLLWSGIAIAAGEIAVAVGLAPTVLRPATAHAVAGTTFPCLALIARTLGSSTAAAEKATAQVERDRSYFRDLVQHAADVVALVSPQFRIDYISPGIEPLVGSRRRRASASTSVTCSASTPPTTSRRAYDTLQPLGLRGV